MQDKKQKTQFEPWHDLAAAHIDTENPLDADWGYLAIEPDGSFWFDKNNRPTDEEIIESSAYQSLVNKAL